MATLKPELKAILNRYAIDPYDKTQVWDCRGTLVLYHKAFEIIAAKEKIRFDPPTVVRSERDEAVVLVVGHMNDRMEWSFGEAVIGQNYQVSGKQAAYVWAMAEKRAKDRVVAKLAGLAQYVYSEDEADEFKDGPRVAVSDTEKPADKPADPPVTETRTIQTASVSIPVPHKDDKPDWGAWLVSVGAAIDATKDYRECSELQKECEPARKNLSHIKPALAEKLAARFDARLKQLAGEEAA